MILPIYSTKPAGEIKTEDGQTFKVTLGLDQTAVNQFTRRSCDLTDTELQRFTTDYKRICQNGYASWYAKERYPFTLLDSEGALAGIIWFGPKEFPELVSGEVPGVQKPWDTFAIRMYEPYRGKRLALPFSQSVFEAYAKMRPDHAVWLDTQNENEGAIRLYKKLGFVECGQRR